MDAPQQQSCSYDGSQEGLAALRGLLCEDPCAAQFGPEVLSKMLHARGHIPHRMEPVDVECLLDALRVEGEVLP
jgi:hypothetical protein